MHYLRHSLRSLGGDNNNNVELVEEIGRWFDIGLGLTVCTHYTVTTIDRLGENRGKLKKGY